MPRNRCETPEPNASGANTVSVSIIVQREVSAIADRQRGRFAASDWPNGARHLGQIRMLIAVNLILGLTTVVVATGGRYLGDYLFATR